MNTINKNIHIQNEEDLDTLLKTKERIFILFYASWCYFSQRFLPIYKKYAQKNKENFRCILIDDKTFLCDKYSINVYPTVLFFEKGNVTKRLDGMSGVGLNEEQLAELIKTCERGK